jgi:hypothetical protein
MMINSVKELIKPIGRPGYAYDFPLETGKLDPKDLKGFIGREVYLQTNGGQFDFLSKTYDHSVTVTDVSDTKVHVDARLNKTYERESVAVSIDTISLIEWTEKITKRVTVRAQR